MEKTEIIQAFKDNLPNDLAFPHSIWETLFDAVVLGYNALAETKVIGSGEGEKDKIIETQKAIIKKQEELLQSQSSPDIEKDLKWMAKELEDRGMTAHDLLDKMREINALNEASTKSSPAIDGEGVVDCNSIDAEDVKRWYQLLVGKGEEAMKQNISQWELNRVYTFLEKCKTAKEKQSEPFKPIDGEVEEKK